MAVARYGMYLEHGNELEGSSWEKIDRSLKLEGSIDELEIVC
jgi:hypothetical protein